MANIKSVGVVGAGLVGTSWAIVFARAGLQVKVYDASESARENVSRQLARSLMQMSQRGLLKLSAQEVESRIEVVPTLVDAVRDADYVQESVREDLTVKREVAAQIATAIQAHSVVGSSTSGFPSSAFTESLKRREQFLVVHPVNPPHLVPVVEIVPAPWTSRDAVALAGAFMRQVGQRPVAVNREIDGFILNRLQGALLDEAWRLYSAGYASVEDIDATISHGLGMRWSFIGPFETIDLNASGGLAGYAEHLAPMYRRIAETRPIEEPWSDEAVARAHAERRSVVPSEDLRKRREWRDEMLLRLLAFKQGE
ncbi:3-hydroxyacyl-CoA dehydrogenase [Microvirga sp. VF16]|uniref:3-hydroxyacyl-CoA dehydrogenase n=1 Tax=Microvirga sp. VF16 TaxID=2807101 RepID=UPI00193D6E78|nr:3-hydroxyacyl-CoA dehydrogenase [Microvirga sp. VF16]QRM32851.1 3-hydroxyacyl-CoA dehydrogenase [Microvirga sp. VF16]